MAVGAEIEMIVEARPGVGGFVGAASVPRLAAPVSSGRSRSACRGVVAQVDVDAERRLGVGRSSPSSSGVASIVRLEAVEHLGEVARLRGDAAFLHEVDHVVALVVAHQIGELEDRCGGGGVASARLRRSGW